MLNQISPTRLFFIFGLQPIIIFFFIYIAYLVYKRTLSQATKMLFLFYLLTAFGFVFNIVVVLISLTEIEWISTFAYSLVSFFLLFPQIYLVRFILKLLVNPIDFNKKKHRIYLLSFCIISFVIVMIPGGITVNESTNWAPSYSWVLLITIYIFYSSFISIPAMVNLTKLLKTFEDKLLRRRLLLFYYGTIGVIVGIYGAALYNTWDDPVFKVIWGLIQLILIPTTTLLIYYGVGKNL